MLSSDAPLRLQDRKPTGEVLEQRACLFRALVRGFEWAACLRELELACDP